jgi:hypothetical protein
VRGINRQSIFEDDEDRQKLLQDLLRYKEFNEMGTGAISLKSDKGTGETTEKGA